jgi:hypothetical protein
MCRRWGGGPLLSTFSGAISFEGAEHITRYRSSEWAERGFCRKCGTHLFYFFLPKSLYFVPVGTFDSADDLQLAREIYIDQKPPGYAFTGDHPRLTEAETLAQYQQG